MDAALLGLWGLLSPYFNNFESLISHINLAPRRERWGRNEAKTKTYRGKLGGKADRKKR